MPENPEAKPKEWVSPEGLGPAQEEPLPPCTSALSGQVTAPPHRGVRRAPPNISLGKRFFLLTPNQGSPPTHPQNEMSACARRSWPQSPMCTEDLASTESWPGEEAGEQLRPRNWAPKRTPGRSFGPTALHSPPQSHKVKRHRKVKYLLTTEGTLPCKWKHPQPVDDGQVGQRRYRQNTG